MAKAKKKRHLAGRIDEHLDTTEDDEMRVLRAAGRWVRAHPEFWALKNWIAAQLARRAQLAESRETL